jgi:hypothetical protein
MKNKKIFALIFLLLISAASVYALTGVKQTDNFYDASTLQPVTNVQEILYTCSNSACATQGSLVRNSNTGTSNSLTFEYPYNPSSTSSNPDYYSHFSFAQCYLPKEYKEQVWGYGAEVSYDYHMQKATSCRSPVDSFSVTNENYANEPVVINITTDFEAEAHSAFTDKELLWFPAGYEDYYSVETKVILEIFDDENNLVYTESKNLNILMDTSQKVSFEWTPTEKGSYIATVKTVITDCQCASSSESYSEKEFVVWEARPSDECYTLINNLKAVPAFGKQGTETTITFDKISNYADNFYNKLPIKTAVTYEITKDNATVYSKDVVLDANPDSVNKNNFSFNWTSDSGGNYVIKVSGTGDNVLCSGKTNPADTAILGYFVDATEKYTAAFAVMDADTGNPLQDAEVEIASQDGFTDSAGKTYFMLNAGNYDWEISKTGYLEKTGSVKLDSDKTIEVYLNKIPAGPSITNVSVVFPNGGETLKGIETILWSATNNLGHSLLMDIFYKKTGAAWTEIAGDEINDGKFDWDTKTVSNGEYLIKICANDTVTAEQVCDVSDSTFSIDNTKKKTTASTVSETFCSNLWDCTEWTACTDGFQSRTCTDLNHCDTQYNKPDERRYCEDGSQTMTIKAVKLNAGKTAGVSVILWAVIIAVIILLLVLIIRLLKR